MTYQEMVFETVRRAPAPMTSGEIYDRCEIDDRDSVYRAVNRLFREGRLIITGHTEAGVITKGAKPKRLYTVAPDATPPNALSISTPKPPQQTAEDTDAELARLLHERVEQADDPADPEAALDSNAWPDAVEEWPGDLPISTRAVSLDDPTIAEIEREGYRLLEPLQQSRLIARRVKAGMPFVGQTLSEKAPAWWSALEELVAMHEEAA